MLVQPKGKTLTYEELNKILSIIPLSELRQTELYVKKDDHWQKGDGWIGWKPALTYVDFQTKLRADTGQLINSSVLNWLKLEKGFVFKNVCRNMIATLRGAVLGKEPDFNILSMDAKPEADPELESKRTKSADELEFEKIDRAITDWWTKRRIHEKLKIWFENKGDYGKAGLDIYVPPGYLDDNGNVKGATFEEVIDAIFVDAPNYDCLVDAEDENYGEKFTVKKLPVDEQLQTPVYKICFIDEDKKTVVREIREGQEKANPIVMDLGGNLLSYVTGEYNEALISPSMKSLQRSVNHNLSMSNYATANINFPQTDVTNAQIDEIEVTGENGKKVKVAKSPNQGSGTWNNWLGQIFSRLDGSEDRKTPTIQHREGKEPEVFDKAAESKERDMYAQAGMLWVKLGDSEYASGDSKIQSMTSYLILLVDHKTMTDTAIVWLLTTVIRLVFHFLGQTAKNNKFRVVASSKLTIGQLSSEDKRIMMEEVKAFLRPPESYILEAGVSDDPVLTTKLIEKFVKVTLERDKAQKTMEAEVEAEARQKFPAPAPARNGNGSGNLPANVN